MRRFRSNLLIVISLIILVSPFIYKIGSSHVWQRIVNQKITNPVEKALKLGPPPVQWLSTSGPFITNETGDMVLLRGVNVSSINWGTDNWNSKAVTYAITQWKANVIRTRVFQDEFEEDPEAFFDKMEREIIEPARKQGVYVILHPWIHDNQPMPDQGTVAMWAAIARRYKDDPLILYDLLAEPRGVTMQQLREAYIQLIEVVRAENPRSLIFVSGLGWGRFINPWLEDPLPYKNIVYRSNPYNKSGEFEGLFGLIAQEYPVFLGEFGAGGYPPMSEESVTDLIAYAQEEGIGWTAWNFSAQGCPCLLADEKQFIPSSYGKIVQNALLSKQKIPKGAGQSFSSSDQELYIYSDFLENGFLDYSWESEIDLQFIAGQENKVIKAEMKPKGAVFLQTDKAADVTQFAGICLRVNKEAIDMLNIRLKTDIDTMSSELQLSDYLSDKNPETTWTTVAVPLANFGLESIHKVKGVLVGNNSNNPIMTIYLDDIYFYK